MDTGGHRTNRQALMVVSVAALAAILSGCSKGPASSAQKYVDDLKLYNYPACYDLLSQRDRIDRTLEQFLTEIPLAPPVSRDWFKGVVRAMNYQVGSVKMVGDDKAVVMVKVTRPDLPLWERTVDSQTGTQAPDALAQKTLNEGKFPKLVYDDDIVLVKQPTGWKVFVDFPAKEAIYKQHQEAVKVYHGHDYDKAIALYQQILQDLDKEQATGNAGLKFVYQRELNDIQNVKSQINDAKAYIPKLKLSDVELKMAASQVPGIFGKIANTGDKVIDEVVCTVTYYKGRGKRKKSVYTEDHTIVATPIEFINFARPVLPLVPGETRKFGFKLNAPVQIQAKTSPDLEVTGIVFTQSKAPLPKPQATPTPQAEASPAASASAATSPSPAAHK